LSFLFELITFKPVMCHFCQKKIPLSPSNTIQKELNKTIFKAFDNHFE